MLDHTRTVWRKVVRGERRIAGRARRLAAVATGRARLAIGVAPISERWGFDRGLPIHRYYLERFLGETSKDIRGACLEFHSAAYTKRFGGAAVTSADVLHIDESNPRATVVADLTKPNSIPTDRFDCIVCTHVLHLILDLERAVAELHRILRPGGVLLVAVPQVSMCQPDFHELWRFTAEGLHVVLARAFPETNVMARAYGNSLTSAGEIRGLAADEFRKAELDHHDPRFGVEVCARAVKA
jgi:SAM-dependent methyltransferase